MNYLGVFRDRVGTEVIFHNLYHEFRRLKIIQYPYSHFIRKLHARPDNEYNEYIYIYVRVYICAQLILMTIVRSYVVGKYIIIFCKRKKTQRMKLLGTYILIRLCSLYNIHTHPHTIYLSIFIYICIILYLL